MKNKVFYDLHIHSCLSPCGDDDMTPGNIAGMAKIKGLDVIALTDHNSCKNCPSFFTQCKTLGITAIAGAEVTTVEDIHVLTLFETLEGAMDFDSFLDKKRVLFENRPDVFGHQILVDENDMPISEEKHLLINAVDISVDDMFEVVRRFNGVAIPAHIDKISNGIVGVLGTVPEASFQSFEFSDMNNTNDYRSRFPVIKGKRLITNSDAHYLWDINEKENFLDISCGVSEGELVKEIVSTLRGDML